MAEQIDLFKHIDSATNVDRKNVMVGSDGTLYCNRVEPTSIPVPNLLYDINGEEIGWQKAYNSNFSGTIENINKSWRLYGGTSIVDGDTNESGYKAYRSFKLAKGSGLTSGANSGVKLLQPMTPVNWTDQQSENYYISFYYKTTSDIEWPTENNERYYFRLFIDLPDIDASGNPTYTTPTFNVRPWIAPTASDHDYDITNTNGQWKKFHITKKFTVSMASKLLNTGYRRKAFPIFKLGVVCKNSNVTTLLGDVYISRFTIIRLADLSKDDATLSDTSSTIKNWDDWISKNIIEDEQFLNYGTLSKTITPDNYLSAVSFGECQWNNKVYASKPYCNFIWTETKWTAPSEIYDPEQVVDEGNYFIFAPLANKPESYLNWKLGFNTMTHTQGPFYFMCHTQWANFDFSMASINRTSEIYWLPKNYGTQGEKYKFDNVWDIFRYNNAKWWYPDATIYDLDYKKKLGFFCSKKSDVSWTKDYNLRFDYNSNNQTCLIAQIYEPYLCQPSSILNQYNKIYGTNITDSDIDCEWCNRWIAGRTLKWLTVKNPNYTDIQFTSNYQIICNDIEIRPELDHVEFDYSTGTIKCKKLVYMNDV